MVQHCVCVGGCILKTVWLWPYDKPRDKSNPHTHCSRHCWLQAENYTRPVVLDDVEAVLARCGDSERLLTRVQRITKREAPEAPIAPPRAINTDTASDAATADAAGGQPERLNVLVMFIDSLGRRHFFRRMPRSSAALQALAERGAGGKGAPKHGGGGKHGRGGKQDKAAGGITALYQFFRYHVTGFHTDPNTHVMYTGSPVENQRECTAACGQEWTLYCSMRAAAGRAGQQCALAACCQ
jgi:hypothetical protein